MLDTLMSTTICVWRERGGGGFLSHHICYIVEMYDRLQKPAPSSILLSDHCCRVKNRP